MAERNDSHLLDGGDSVGMTDNQYKGMLLDQLEMDTPDESHTTLYAYDKPICTIGEDK